MTQLNEPISWLQLERYALGELPPSERQAIEARLAESADDRACLQEILTDRTELPELPRIVPRRTVARRNIALALGTALAAAASVTLLLLQRESLESVRSLGGAKGGEIALSLQSERGLEQPSSFSQGERFKLFVTCPPQFSRALSVLVFQGGERFEPLGGARQLACGNLVPWPGAFALDGREPATICVTWARAPGGATQPGELGDEAACRELAPR